MLKAKKDVSKRFQKIGQDIQNTMSIFISTVTSLIKSNEELDSIENEITTEVSKLNEVHEGIKKQRVENNKVIEKINALMS